MPSLRHVLKTNFYQPTKVALSFRLAPDFLPETEYPKKPFGMFFVIGEKVFLLARELRMC
jgi:glutamate dehydrogenase